MSFATETSYCCIDWHVSLLGQQGSSAQKTDGKNCDEWPYRRTSGRNRDRTAATLIGESTCGKSNCYGDVRLLELPNTHMKVACSTKYFKLRAVDELWLMPDLVVEQTSKLIPQLRPGWAQSGRQRPLECLAIDKAKWVPAAGRDLHCLYVGPESWLAHQLGGACTSLTRGIFSSLFNDIGADRIITCQHC